MLGRRSRSSRCLARGGSCSKTRPCWLRPAPCQRQAKTAPPFAPPLPTLLKRGSASPTSFSFMPTPVFRTPDHRLAGCVDGGLTNHLSAGSLNFTHSTSGSQISLRAFVALTRGKRSCIETRMITRSRAAAAASAIRIRNDAVGVDGGESEFELARFILLRSRRSRRDSSRGLPTRGCP